MVEVNVTSRPSARTGVVYHADPATYVDVGVSCNTDVFTILALPFSFHPVGGAVMVVGGTAAVVEMLTADTLWPSVRPPVAPVKPMRTLGGNVTRVCRTVVP